jgi:hypothetical protein
MSGFEFLALKESLIMEEDRLWHNPLFSILYSYLEQTVRGIDRRIAQCLFQSGTFFGVAGSRRYNLKLPG